jgi:hypothetical protein
MIRWLGRGMFFSILLMLSCCAEVNYTPPEGSTEIAITHFSFGKIVVAGKRFESDIAISADGSVKNWHARINHAIHLRDLEALMKGPVTKLIIGVGTDKKCSVSAEIMNTASARQIEIHILDTFEAVKLFNASEKTGLAACFHLTC